MSKEPLVILTGPTAVGKTKLSIALAKAINGEIISADSMQVYRGMDIGSAKVTQEEMQGVTHYLIDILDPTEDFNVVSFQQKALEAIAQIRAKGKIPIVVGGTGFYIQALLYQIDFSSGDPDASDQNDQKIREQYEQYAVTHGKEALHALLQEVDPESAAQIHYNNVKRVVRALEFHKLTGKKISEHNEQERQKESAYNACYFVLTDDRAKLYQRIDARVDKMVEDGLVEEVRSLLDHGLTEKNISMQGLGYKEIIAYLKGECTLEEAIYIIKRDTRHFAKRQLTWFGREKEVIWLDRQCFFEEALLQEILRNLTDKGIWKGQQ